MRLPLLRSDRRQAFFRDTSENGSDWDEGSAYYHNNLNLTDGEENFLLIRYSDSYHNRVNVMHTRLRVRK